jgi:class 3 adenylate cyclase
MLVFSTTKVRKLTLGSLLDGATKQYVAITGCPNPQKQHAKIMALFARDCMQQLRDVTHNLSEQLGEDTRDLAMRCGLHSGSVTAGVLRGEKGRFQLFGSNVNEAARMEQTGKADSIHASQGFADALRADGKGKWLVPREDKVFAKGYGEVSTYWVQVVSDNRYSDTYSMVSGYSGDNIVEKGGLSPPQSSASEDGNNQLFTEVDI